MEFIDWLSTICSLYWPITHSVNHTAAIQYHTDTGRRLNHEVIQTELTLQVTGTIFAKDPNLVITVTADVLAPNGARPSAVAMLIAKLDMSPCKRFSGCWRFCGICCSWLLMVLDMFSIICNNSWWSRSHHILLHFCLKKKWKLTCVKKCPWCHNRMNISCKKTFLNPLVPGTFEQNLRKSIVRQILLIDGWNVTYKIALRWMVLTDDKSTLVKVMAWCRQANFYKILIMISYENFLLNWTTQWGKLTLTCSAMRVHFGAGLGIFWEKT